MHRAVMRIGYVTATRRDVSFSQAGLAVPTRLVDSAAGRFDVLCKIWKQQYELPADALQCGEGKNAGVMFVKVRKAS